MTLEEKQSDALHYAEHCDFQMDLYPEDEWRKEEAAEAWRAYNALFDGDE